MVKLAALTEICTPDLRDMIYQQIDTVNLETDAEIEKTYKTVKEKLISWTSNRLSAGMYADMNIGNVVQHQPCEVETEWEENWETEYEVNMTGQCYTCGRVGHPRRLCPSKGEGKGKGKSKGYQPQQQSAP